SRRRCGRARGAERLIGAYLDLARFHAPLLAILAPLIGAALCVATPSRRLSWVLAVVAATAGAIFATDFAARTFGGGPLPAAIEGVQLALDGVGVFMSAVLAWALALTLIAAGALFATFETRVASFAFALTLCVGAAWQ